eukprot:TRINITY_DN68171_c0_g1_i1.p1 TRINITY_DN68171_c0_g1~~TRINITY_DN68171_c0_g1_i1.p1  ORF type:complete len:497 (-),score=69.23 TRINITY_DN68171_c0_g1_i1:3-1412(-)
MLADLHPHPSQPSGLSPRRRKRRLLRRVIEKKVQDEESETDGDGEGAVGAGSGGVSIAGMTVEWSEVAGAPALLLTVAVRQYMLLVGDQQAAQSWAQSLVEAGARLVPQLGSSPAGSDSEVQSLAAARDGTQSVVTPKVVAATPAPSETASFQQPAVVAPPLLSTGHRKPPSRRTVINDTHLCLEPPEEPLTLSVSLLREAIACCNGATEFAGHNSGNGGGGGSSSSCRDGVPSEVLRRGCCGLKCVDLTVLGEQDLWSFWVNVYHCLVLHAQLLFGKPSVARIAAFYNNSSYVVAGHSFTLTEVEHCVLRRRMTKPQLGLTRLFLRTRNRTAQQLERRPHWAAPPAPAAAFACRADWRLNLVLSAGNESSGPTIPVFERCSEEEFDARLTRAISATLASTGQVDGNGGSVRLPYSLWRYRHDAPAGDNGEATEKRWARALGFDPATRVKYSGRYNWRFRNTVEIQSSD